MAVPVFELDGILASDPTAPYVDRILALEPGAYWRLDDPVASTTAADDTGNGNTGTVNGTVTFGQPGLITDDADTAALFDGATGYITVPPSATWKPTTALTMAVWFQLTSLPATNTEIYIGFGGSSGLARYAGLGIGVDPSGASFIDYNGLDSTGNGFGALFYTPLSIDTPYFLVITDDGAATADLGMVCYLNGVLVGKISRQVFGGGFSSDTSESLTIGAKTTVAMGYADFFPGVLDEFALFPDYVLPPEQASLLYASRLIAVPRVYVNLGKAKDLAVTRGKQQALDVVQAGTMTSTLLNLDRNLDPTNPSSTFYPNLKPMRRVRATGTIAATTYTLFTGFAERWPQVRVGPNYADTPLQAVDGFEPLSLSEINAVYPQELSGSRVGRALDAAAWPSMDRALDAGQFQIQGGTITSVPGSVQPVLTHIQDVELSERGLFFIDGSGNAVFFDAHNLMLRTASVATFSDEPGAGEYAYSNVVSSYDRDQIFNDWSDTRTGGTLQQATDGDSIASYWDRPQNSTSLLASDTDSLALMQLKLSQYAQPGLRFDQIAIRPGDDTATWQAVLAREIGHRITVKEQPPGGGPQIVWDGFIVWIDYKITAEVADSTITWALLPASTLANYWVIDDAVYGVLDQGYIVAPA